MKERKYLDIDKMEGYPSGKKIRYECTICDTIVKSTFKEIEPCKCKNIDVDCDAGRLIIKDKKNFKIFELV